MGKPEIIEGRNWDAETASEYIGCTAGTIRVWTSRKMIPYVKINGLTRFRKKDLDAWMEKNTVRPVAV